MSTDSLTPPQAGNPQAGNPQAANGATVEANAEADDGVISHESAAEGQSAAESHVMAQAGAQQTAQAGVTHGQASSDDDLLPSLVHEASEANPPDDHDQHGTVAIHCPLEDEEDGRPPGSGTTQPPRPAPHPSAACDVLDASLSNRLRYQLQELFDPRMTPGVDYPDVQIPHLRPLSGGSLQLVERLVATGDVHSWSSAIDEAKTAVLRRQEAEAAEAAAAKAAEAAEAASTAASKQTSVSPQPDVSQAQTASDATLSGPAAEGDGVAPDEPMPRSDDKGKGKAVAFDDSDADTAMGGMTDNVPCPSRSSPYLDVPNAMTDPVFSKHFVPGSFDQQVYMARESDGSSSSSSSTPRAARQQQQHQHQPPAGNTTRLPLTMPSLASIQNGSHFAEHGTPRVSVQGRYFAPSDYSNPWGMETIEWLTAVSYMDPVPGVAPPAEASSASASSPAPAQASTETEALSSASPGAGPPQQGMTTQHADAHADADSDADAHADTAMQLDEPPPDNTTNSTTTQVAPAENGGQPSSGPGHPLSQVQTHQHAGAASHVNQPLSVRGQPQTPGDQTQMVRGVGDEDQGQSQDRSAPSSSSHGGPLDNSQLGRVAPVIMPDDTTTPPPSPPMLPAAAAAALLARIRPALTPARALSPSPDIVSSSHMPSPLSSSPGMGAPRASPAPAGGDGAQERPQRYVWHHCGSPDEPPPPNTPVNAAGQLAVEQPARPLHLHASSLPAPTSSHPRPLPSAPTTAAITTISRSRRIAGRVSPFRANLPVRSSALHQHGARRRVPRTLGPTESVARASSSSAAYQRRRHHHIRRRRYYTRRIRSRSVGASSPSSSSSSLSSSSAASSPTPVGGSPYAMSIHPHETSSTPPWPRPTDAASPSSSFEGDGGRGRSPYAPSSALSEAGTLPHADGDQDDPPEPGSDQDMGEAGYPDSDLSPFSDDDDDGDDYDYDDDGDYYDYYNDDDDDDDDKEKSGYDDYVAPGFACRHPDCRRNPPYYDYMHRLLRHERLQHNLHLGYLCIIPGCPWGSHRYPTAQAVATHVHRHHLRQLFDQVVAIGQLNAALRVLPLHSIAELEDDMEKEPEADLFVQYEMLLHNIV